MNRQEASTDLVHYGRTDTPLGAVLLVGRGRTLTGLLPAERVRPQPGWVRDDKAFADAVAQLDEYFRGRRTTFELDVRPSGTPFQLATWEAMREVPFGQTISYGRLAASIGRPGSARAVGAASGRNPIPIVVPCHRVVGSNGALTGFGWGIERKAWLLEHELAGRRGASAKKSL